MSEITQDKKIKAWWFAPLDNRLRFGDNRLVQLGITHTVLSPPKLCNNGTHGSLRVVDALRHATTTNLYRVELFGDMDIDTSKIAAQNRTYLKRYGLEKILTEFARQQVLTNLGKVEPYTNQYTLISEWLMYGDIELRDAARLAAKTAVRTAKYVAFEGVCHTTNYSFQQGDIDTAVDAARVARIIISLASNRPVLDTANVAIPSLRDDRAPQEAMLINMIENEFGVIE